MSTPDRIVIVGGAVIGSAIAYFLTADPDFDGEVVVIERDPTYARAATALSAASIRTQFSSALNVKISQFGVDFIRSFADRMAIGRDRPDLNFHEGGYLFLAATDQQAATLRANHAVQVACCADVVLWNADELAQAFPHLNTADIWLASYGRSGEGWFNNTGLMNGFRAKAIAQGAVYRHDTVVGIDRVGARVTQVRLASGAVLATDHLVNAAGPRAGLVAQMAGLDLPVEPRKRTTFVFDCAHSPEGSARINAGRLPLMIDPSGVYCRPEGRYFMTAAPPREDPAVDPDDFTPVYDEFDDLIWPVLAARAPAFEAIKVINQWAGHYDYNTFDQNLIVGPHPEVENFIFANGFSGHGLQQAPATGRAVAEWLVHGSYRTLDFSEAGYSRLLNGRPARETAVI